MQFFAMSQECSPSYHHSLCELPVLLVLTATELQAEGGGATAQVQGVGGGEWARAL